MHGSLGAQEPRRDTTTTPQPDSITVVVPATPAEAALVDSAAGVDSSRIVVTDTLKAPLASPHLPRTGAIGPDYEWDRDELFASGALTLIELLEQIPGVTALRSGWLTSPQIAAYLGNPSAVRVFYDGAEIDALDGRNGGLLDLAAIPIWSLDRVVVERGAGELRVYLRSWTYRRVQPNTRTDVFTGDEDTNLYRAFYAKRFSRGEALQLAAQQFGTTAERGTGADGDQLSLMLRSGWAGGPWSADAFVARTRQARSVQRSRDGTRAIPPLEGTATLAYLRAGYGSPEDAGPWAQVMAVHQRFKETTGRSEAGGLIALDTADTSRSRAQYVVAVGITRGPLRVSGTNRTRVFGGGARHAQSARASLGFDRASVSLFAERGGTDSSTRAEASARFAPLPFVELLGAAALVHDDRPSAARADSRFARAEVGLLLGDLWVGGGGMYRDSVSLAAPVVFDTAFADAVEPRALGVFAVVRGRAWRSIYLDVTASRWESRGFYRPRFQSRSRIFLSTSWLSRFPGGDFGALVSFQHEYRTEMPVPGTDAMLIAPASHVVSTLLEVRIMSAVLSWQSRNIVGLPYQIVPGYDMPRTINLYGVRWNFWN